MGMWNHRSISIAIYVPDCLFNIRSIVWLRIVTFHILDILITHPLKQLYQGLFVVVFGVSFVSHWFSCSVLCKLSYSLL